MFKPILFLHSAALLSVFLFFPNSILIGQTAKKRHIDKKAIKFNIGEMALADIPIASKLGVSYELLLDRNYGIQLGMGYLSYPILMWGNDSTSKVWRTNVFQRGYNFDLSFRHYFDEADESAYYLSTFFSTSRLWLDINSLERIIVMKKDRAVLILGYQKKWRSLYLDINGGLGIKFQNWKTHLQQMPFNALRPSSNYVAGAGWNFQFDKPLRSISIPVQLLIGFRF